MTHYARGNDRPAFTLVELLVVMGVIALLVGMLLPAISKVRIAANIVKARSDLRQIAVALMMYQQDHQRQLPPTRFSCSSRTEYELPVELAEGKYLPAEPKTFGPVVSLRDVFSPDDTYKYRAVGSAIVNETTLMESASTLWVPAGYPNCDGLDGQYWDDPRTSPVRYALWSVGPRPAGPPPVLAPGRAPIPSAFWYRASGGGGVITVFQDKAGDLHMSD